MTEEELLSMAFQDFKRKHVPPSSASLQTESMAGFEAGWLYHAEWQALRAQFQDWLTKWLSDHRNVTPTSVLQDMCWAAWLAASDVRAASKK